VHRRLGRTSHRAYGRGVARGVDGGTLVVVRELIALLLPGGPGFVDAVQRAWENGDAVLPLDPSAPRALTDALVAAMAPTQVVEDEGGLRPVPGGRPVEPGDALVVATSGTTGAPKGVVHTHAAVEYAAFATATATGVAPDSRWLACLPLWHVGGLGVVTRSLLTGSALEIHNEFDPERVDEAARGGATHVSLVPTALARIDPTSWRTILLGGSSIPADRPPNTIATYGMTETFGGIVYDGLALSGVEVRVIDPEHDHRRHDGPGRPRLAPAGIIGPIEVRSPTLLRSYRDGTDPVGRDGWYRTGDLGSIDEIDRRLVVHGRGDDVIITGGENVWPEVVEALLRTDERVRDVAVIGVPDREWGHRVVAVVVPADPDAPPGLDALRDLVRAQLPRAAAPKDLRIVETLPRTSLGKIRRHAVTAAQLAVSNAPRTEGE